MRDNFIKTLLEERAKDDEEHEIQVHVDVDLTNWLLTKL